MTFSILCAILFGLSGRERPDRAWYLGVAQLVARYLGVVEAASSSLVTQTKKRRSYDLRFSLFSVVFLSFSHIFEADPL